MITQTRISKLLPKSKSHFFEMALLLLLVLAWNQGAYYGGRLIAHNFPHIDVTSSLDAFFPLVPWTVAIYFGCYLFWGINYYLCALRDRSERDRFFCADAISKVVCLVFFIVLPTTNIRPEITGTGFWDDTMRVLYTIDSADNLFPSIHCLVSWFCWIGVRGRKDIPAVYRWFSLLMALAVCVSTLTTKQHVIIDVVGGVALAELCWFLAGFDKVRRLYSAGYDRLFGLVFKR